MIFLFIAIIATGLFAGGSLYINLVEHPARTECGTEFAATEFVASYYRAAKLQAGLAAVGFVFGVVASWSLGHFALLVGALLLGAVIPFTLVVIQPTNAQLLASDLDKNSPLTAGLLAQWQRLHAVRTLLSLAAFAMLVWSVLGSY